jgi:hypothetical protein
MLPIQDGIIFCVSGECRHKGDLDIAKRRLTSLQSQLANDTNTDGYTSLYSTRRVYSGTSWDELMDPQCGIQARLLAELTPHSKSAWDKLVDTGKAAAMEGIINQIEINMRQVKSDMTRFWKTQITFDIKRALQSQQSVTLHLTMADKMEKLHVTYNHSTFSCHLERYASDFQIPDQKGVFALLESSKQREMTPVSFKKKTETESCSKIQQ